jgi:hypothetical protein
MAENDAFTAGVKPGGLTSSTQIRLLLCYLIQSAQPLSRQEIETALLGEQLVNYFELGAGLEDVVAHGLAAFDGQRYTITKKGQQVSAELEQDLPRSVREAAVSAAIRAQVWNRKSSEYRAEVRESGSGFSVLCTIVGLTGREFSLELMMPDRLTAEMVKKRFILRGNEVYESLLTQLTEPDPVPKDR